jgi:hypothetical protein
MTAQLPKGLKVGVVVGIAGALACWLAAAAVFFFLGIGPPRNAGGFLAAAALFVVGLAMIVAVTFVNYRVRTRLQPASPVDPGRATTARRAAIWATLAWLPMAGGLAWLVYASLSWPLPRGALIGIAGLVVGLAASSALIMPALRLLGPERRMMGMSVTTFTVVNVVILLLFAMLMLRTAFIIH